jgi:hypothetical protein
MEPGRISDQNGQAGPGIGAAAVPGETRRCRSENAYSGSGKEAGRVPHFTIIHCIIALLQTTLLS